MVKFQHLILPGFLWVGIGACAFFFTPSSPLIIGSFLCLVACTVYFSLRVFTHTRLPLIISCCVFLFLLSSILSGFNIINLLLIGAIGTLVSLLGTNR